MWQRRAIGQTGTFTCVCSDCAIGTFCQYNRRSVCNNLGTVIQPATAFNEDAQPGSPEFAAVISTLECDCENGWSGQYCDDDSELQARESADNFHLAYILAPIGLVMYCVTMGVNRRSARYKKATSRFMSAFVHFLAIVDFGSDIAFVIVSLHSPRFVDLIDGVDGCAGRSTDNSSQIQAVGAAFLALSSIVFAVKLYRDADRSDLAPAWEKSRSTVRIPAGRACPLDSSRVTSSVSSGSQGPSSHDTASDFLTMLFQEAMQLKRDFPIIAVR
jgi:hypothetical protein